MNENQVKKTICVLASQNYFSLLSDELNGLIEKYDVQNEELDINELELVSAAGFLSYQQFLTRMNEKHRN